MLELKNICKHFSNTNQNVLENINLTIHDGEFICLVGPSGTGKSTLLNIIAGLETPSSGTITLDNKNICEPDNDRVMMFQESALFPWMNVINNVKMGLKHSGLSKEEQKKKACSFLNMVRMGKYSEYKINQLSGGMKQRVQLARALAIDSKLLLMDEPFSALDKQTTNLLRAETAKICKNTKKTVILITHSVEEAVYFADRVFLMSAKEHTITNIYEIDLERPRHIESKEFLNYRKEILYQLQNHMDNI